VGRFDHSEAWNESRGCEVALVKPLARKTDVVYPGAGRPTVVAISDSGVLACDTCLGGWCDHIEFVVTENIDAGWIWFNNFNNLRQPQSGTNYIVPFVPTQGLWATISFGEKIRGGTELYLVPDRSIDSGQDIGFFLGFTNPGEGRAVWRGMIHSHFEAWVADKSAVNELICRQGVHRLKSEIRWTGDMKSQEGRLAQYWSLYIHDTCLGCLEQMTEDDFDDFAPEA
jgi:hypothetical protein